MTLEIKDLSIKNFERVVQLTDDTTKLNCIISIHNTNLGPSMGGVRSWEYSNFDAHLNDALNLSESMTLKNSICGINFGGGKAVINLKGIKKTADLYKSYAEGVEKLKGKYITACDVGTTTEDLIECSKVTKYVSGIKLETSEPTAKGLLYAIKSCQEFMSGNNSLKNIHVAISGVGKVGGKLATLLYEEGSKISASNIDKNRIIELKKIIEFNEVGINELYKTKCDIISPCALGKSINSSSIKALRCKSIIGAANNQLDSEETAKWLMKNDIIYCPDYLVNSGGVIAVSCDINNTENLLDKELKKISIRVRNILEESIKNNKSTVEVAKRIAWERINN